MPAARRHLSLVPDPSPDPGVTRRNGLAELLEQLAEIIEGGAEWKHKDTTVRPTAGVMVVLLDEDGRPSPFGNVTALDVQAALADAAQAVTMLAHGADLPAVYAAHDRVLDRRRSDAAARAADDAERRFPCESPCGYRAKSESGLTTHQRSARCTRPR